MVWWFTLTIIESPEKEHAGQWELTEIGCHKMWKAKTHRWPHASHKPKFTKPFKVEFFGGYGVDDGGLSKEYLRLI